MKTIKLKAVHRLVLIALFGGEGQKGHSLSELNDLLKFDEKIRLSEEEIKKLNLRVEESSYKWDAKDKDGVDVDEEKDFELSDDQVNLLLKTFKEKDDKKEFTLNNLSPILEIAEKIGFEFKK